MSNALEDKLKKLRVQGKSAEEQGKIIPRELLPRGVPDRQDKWEVGNVYDRNTRQGQNYAHKYIKNRAQLMASRTNTNNSGKENSKVSKTNKKDMDEYIRKVQEMRASKADSAGSDFKGRAAKTRAQGYSAARQGKIYPRGLQNTAEDTWEDAKVYDANTRQGQNHCLNHMKGYGEELVNKRKKVK